MRLVCTFNQITENFVLHLNNRGFLNEDGTVKDTITIFICGPQFNIKLMKENTLVRNFIKSVDKRKHVFCMPTFGRAIAPIATHDIAVKSKIPYTFGVDTFVTDKIQKKYALVCKEFASQIIESKSAPDTLKATAKTVIDNMNVAISKIKQYIAENANIEYHAYQAFLTETLGENWQKKSNHMNFNDFLALFGADDEFLTFYRAMTFDDKGVQAPLPNEARWICKFIELLKPITVEFNNGSLADMATFAAMVAQRNNNFNNVELSDQKTFNDQTTAEVMNLLTPEAVQDAKIDEAYFDMEPDDVGVLSYLKEHSPNTSIVRVYVDRAVQKRAERLFSEKKLEFSDNDFVLIDSQLGNFGALAGMYFDKKIKTVDELRALDQANAMSVDSNPTL